MKDFGSPLVGSYDYQAVALSILLAVAGSYAALELAERVTAAWGRARFYWLIGGAFAMATSTWAMHYVGMLAFRLPLPILYHWPTALLSFVPSLAASALGLFIVSRKTMGHRRAWLSSVFMGGGIAALHYTGMESMRVQAMCHYSPALVTLSVLLAIAVSLLSLWFMFLFRRDTLRHWLRKTGGALLMGAAITGMHYTGMASASFTRTSQLPDLTHATSVSSLGVIGIAAVAFLVLAVAVITSLLDRLHNSRELLRSLNARHQSLIERECMRISREIHDDLGQKLTGLKMDLMWAERKLDTLGNVPVVHAILDRIVEATEAVDNLLQSIQDIAAEIRPGVLDKLGLGAALQYEARRLQERTGISCEVHLPETEPVLSTEISTTLFRIFQECLTNVARHAGATKVITVVLVENDWVTLSVQDDGCGLTEAEIAHPRSLGLRGMEERTLLYGGEIQFQRGASGGTVIRVHLPRLASHTCSQGTL